MDKVEEKKIIKAIKQGDKKAFEVIYINFYPKLMNYPSIFIEKSEAHDIKANFQAIIRPYIYYIYTFKKNILSLHAKTNPPP
jgi:hypothetical protein